MYHIRVIHQPITRPQYQGTRSQSLNKACNISNCAANINITVIFMKICSPRSSQFIILYHQKITIWKPWELLSSFVVFVQSGEKQCNTHTESKFHCSSTVMHNKPVWLNVWNFTSKDLTAVNIKSIV